MSVVTTSPGAGARGGGPNWCYNGPVKSQAGLFQRRRVGRAEHAASDAEPPPAGPSPKEEHMFRHLLIPTDGSPLSDEAVRQGVELAADMGAEILFITVTEPFHAFSLGVDQVEDTRSSYDVHMRERAARILGEASEAAAAAG